MAIFLLKRLLRPGLFNRAWCLSKTMDNPGKKMLMGLIFREAQLLTDGLCAIQEVLYGN